MTLEERWLRQRVPQLQSGWGDTIGLAIWLVIAFVFSLVFCALIGYFAWAVIWSAL